MVLWLRSYQLLERDKPTVFLTQSLQQTTLGFHMYKRILTFRLMSFSFFNDAKNKQINVNMWSLINIIDSNI